MISEFKSSRTVPLARNQEKAFIELLEVGGNVAGKGKEFFEGDV